MVLSVIISSFLSVRKSILYYKLYMEAENKKQQAKEKYTELSKKSLVRVQYSCSGNDNGIEEEEYIPIVSIKPKNESTKNEDETKNS